MSSADGQGAAPAGGAVAVVIIVSLVVIMVKIAIVFAVCDKLKRARVVLDSNTIASDTRFQTLTMDKFLDDMEREKPIRFTSQQLRIATDNFTISLGAGAFGSVYKGIFNNETTVAVKVLHDSSEKIIKEQFMAEFRTIGRVHHVNLLRLYGFCFENDTRAIVYEYMGNGSLDKYLFHEKNILGFERLHEIAVGTARGIAYMHEECQPRIIHYDIKPENILLDAQFCPKVADFGLAKLCNRENTHITMSGRKGTPGYAAPEMWTPFHVTHKCDVYSFGMLLFEIIGRRRNFDDKLPDSQRWFPRWVWKMFEDGELGEMIIVCGVEENHREMAERMVKVALWCVQYQPESRPVMSAVVKMLEGAIEIQPPLCPFQHMMDVTPGPNASFNPLQSGSTTFDSEYSSQMVTGSGIVRATPVMRKYEIEIASV